MLKIVIKPSATLLAILLFAHGSAIAILHIVGLPALIQFTANTILALSLVYTVRRHALLHSPQSVAGLEISSDNALSAQLRRGAWVECEVCGDTYVASFLTVLNLRRIDTRKRFSVTLVPDMIDADDFRKLRVWLRWKPKRSEGGREKGEG